MPPGKIPTNDFDRALMALVKSKSDVFLTADEPIDANVENRISQNQEFDSKILFIRVESRLKNP